MLPPSDYQALFAALPDFHLACTPDGTVAAASAGAIQATGQPLAQVLGQAVTKVFTHLTPLAPAGLAQVLPLALQQVLERQQPYQITTAGWQHRCWPVSGPEQHLRFLLYRAEPVASAADPASLHHLLDTAPALLWTTDAAGQATYHSPRWLQYTGFTMAQAAGEGWQQAVHPDDLEQLRHAWAQARRTETDYVCEYRLRHHDGRYRWHLGRAAAHRSAAGQLTGWVGTTLDIDDQKQVQQRLATQERHMQQILSQVPAYIATLLGPDHVYGFLNEKSRQLLGSAVQVGMPAAQAVPDLGRTGYLRLVDKIYRSGQPFLLSEMPSVAPPEAGELAGRTLYFDGVLQPLADEQGRTQGILVFGIDVTERVEAKQRTAELMAEIREQDQQFRTMVESMPLFMFIRDVAGKVLYVNPQRFAYTGQQPDPDFSQWEEPIHPADRASLHEHFARGQEQGQAWTLEYRLRRHDGQYRWHLLRTVPLLAPDGSVVRWYGSSVDIDDQKRLVEELERKDQQLQRILSNLPALVNTMEGPEHRYTFLSEQFQRLIGHRAQLGRRVVDAQPEVAEQGFVAVLDEVYRTGEPFTATEQRVDLLQEDGTLMPHYFNFSYQLLPPLANQPQTRGILSFAVDVTEQVLARQQAASLSTRLQHSDERLRRMTEALPVMTFINNAQGHTEYTSPQWWHYAGYPDATDVNEVWNELLHPDDRARAQAEYAAAQAEQRGWNIEVRLRRHDGQYRWHLSHTVAAHTVEGLKWYGSTVDIHEQKELQDQLRRSEEQFRFMAESIPQIVWTARPDGTLDYFNQRWTELTGMPVAQALEFGWAELIPPPDREAVLAKFMAGMRSGRDYEQESRLLSVQDGRYRWFLHRGTPMRDAQGQLIKWFGTSTDIDDLRQAREQLEAQNAQLARTNADLDSFVYTASHDLKQPINNMAGIFEELLRSAYFRDPEAQQLVLMFERALQQIHQTIHDLSDVVQLQRRHALVPAEDVALLPLVQEVIGSMQEQSQALGATFTLDFTAVPTVRFVRPNLQSIFYNLLSNALKYADPARPPRIEVTGSLRGGVPVLTVADNGQGIDLERYGKDLFQLFRRFHEHVEGSGMGLYLVNRMVQLNGGWLEVDSTVGVGTTFRIYCNA